MTAHWYDIAERCAATQRLTPAEAAEADAVALSRRPAWCCSWCGEYVNDAYPVACQPGGDCRHRRGRAA